MPKSISSIVIDYKILKKHRSDSQMLSILIKGFLAYLAWSSSFYKFSVYF